MMTDAGIARLAGYGGFGLIKSPGETAHDVNAQDVVTLNTMLQSMSSAQQDAVYDHLTANSAVVDMAGIVSGMGFDVHDDAASLVKFVNFTAEQQEAVMTFSDVTNASSIKSTIDRVENGDVGSNYSFSNDIYLNASEEAITSLLKDGTVSDKAFNFGFYTKMDLVTDAGNVTVNVKLHENAGLTEFRINEDDIDVSVESFYKLQKTKVQELLQVVKLVNLSRSMTQVILPLVTVVMIPMLLVMMAVTFTVVLPLSTVTLVNLVA